MFRTRDIFVLRPQIHTYNWQRIVRFCLSDVTNTILCVVDTLEGQQELQATLKSFCALDTTSFFMGLPRKIIYDTI